jgi:hypothetical protein
MVKLRAEVKECTGKTRHSIGGIVDGKLVEISQIPVAKWVEIEETEEGFYLFHYNDDGECISDTWHQSVSEAMSQAEFEFNIKKADWREIE